MSELGNRGTSDQPRLRDALERVRPKMAALRESELKVINLDPLAAATVARGALPGLLSIRSTLVQVLGSFDPEHLDWLEIYALALIQADTVYKGITAKPDILGSLSAEAYSLRARLLADATILVQRGYISSPRLSKLCGPNGHQNIASDVLTLAGLLRDSWPTIENRTAILYSELDRAEVLGERLIEAIGTRKQLTALAVDAALQRQRAFTLFIRAYTEVRRAVVYLRWYDGDADGIAPSLYGKRKVRRKKAESEALPRSTGASQNTDVAAPSDSTSAGPAQVGASDSDPFLH